MHEQELVELGLSPNEARIYLALLPLGATTPQRISSRTGLHRAYVYDALERLLEKGVVSEIIMAGKKHFQASPPTHLLQMERQRLERLEQAIPFLSKLSKEPGGETKVELHRGSSAVKMLFRDVVATLRKGDEFLGYGLNEEEFMREVPIVLRQYLKKIIREGISERMIIREGGATLPEAKTTTYRSLPEKYLGNAGTWVYGDKVALLVFGTPEVGIIIENRQMAETYRHQFELLWARARPLREALIVRAAKKRI